MTLPNTSVFNFYEGTDPQHYTDLTGVNLNAGVKALLANDVAIKTAVTNIESGTTKVGNADKLDGVSSEFFPRVDNHQLSNNLVMNPFFTEGIDKLDYWGVGKAGITIEVMDPRNKGFSTPYTGVRNENHVDIQADATPLNPLWVGAWISVPKIENFSTEVMRNGFNHGWDHVAGNIIKVTYDGLQSDGVVNLINTLNAVLVSPDNCRVITSAFLFIESGLVTLGNHPGYNGYTHTKVYARATPVWEYAEDDVRNDYTSGFSASLNQNHMGIGFQFDVPTVVYIALPSIRYKTITTNGYEKSTIVNKV